MRLYAGNITQFIKDNTQNQIAGKLHQAFFNWYGFKPSPNEENAWRNSLRALTMVFYETGFKDHGILLEYQLPLSSKRLDCMVCGKDGNRLDHAVIIELKQWAETFPSDGDNELMTYLGGGLRDVLHPSAQVGQYHQYLNDTHTAFYEGQQPVQLKACSYLHNYTYTPQDPLLEKKFSNLLESYPVFSQNDTDELTRYLVQYLEAGEGQEVLARIEESKYRPSKKLMDHVASVVKGQKQYVLLDEQLIVYDRITTSIQKGFHDQQKTVVVVKGGPGTGKSVIAINVMADLLEKGYNAQYATGSRAFTETLRKVIGSRGASQFKYFNSYANATSNEIDVLICDESHRIRQFSHNRFTPASKRSSKAQLEELIHAGKVNVFFIDDDQIVRPNEIGSVQLIREMAEKLNCKLFEYELEIQFRCNGSDGFVNWINNTLGIRRTANVLWEGNEQFDFRVVDSPKLLEELLKHRIIEGHTARMVAGFVWPWSKATQSNGSLVEDVQIGYYKRPWNAHPEIQGLDSRIPKADLWAYDPNGFNQIGCIYTTQGFEFDYVGVIFGNDLIYDWEKMDWDGRKENSYDRVVKSSREKFLALVKNTYRVLLSRGLKGCYVHFMDKGTERFFRSRMQVQ